ncbi:MAG: hypothetical protein KDE56_11290 [Anaerolineales bacterium]|nr:hypothetical protein [Anaerolineales bacterium]
MTQSQDYSFSNIPVDRVSLRKLRQLVVARFNLDELNNLIFDLGLNPEEIAGETLSTRVLNTLLTVQRQGKLPQLLREVHRLHPKLTTADLQREGDTAPIPVITETEIARAEEGLRTVEQHLSIPLVHTAIISFGNDFATTQRELTRLYTLKRIHDLFQTLEFQYSLLHNEQNRLKGQEADFWESIFLTEPEIQGVLGDLLAAAQNPELLAAETRWTQQVEQIQHHFRQAIEQSNYTSLKTATESLTRLLNRQPTRINVQLVAASRSLGLSRLATLMGTISTALAVSSEHMGDVPQLQAGVTALQNLEQRVLALASDHDAWQELDEELRQVEVSLGQDLAYIEESWLILRQLGELLFFDQEEDWAAELKSLTGQLDNALTARLVVPFRRLFRRFSTLANRRFYWVDRQLLALGKELQQVGESLNGMVGKI